ncbi:MAG: 2-C-methyl-D-erythritol 4-phosphate cytidylyltransferase, partial [Deltaproteobacteria bacterium]|nr:2-C-methyl-D-erythritol 4-phosphate cytidylyltransferase [Deltaproteobacteria bacterium]
MVKASVVIVAAGSGRRVGQKKQFIALRGIPVLKRSVSVFD